MAALTVQLIQAESHGEKLFYFLDCYDGRLSKNSQLKYLLDIKILSSTILLFFAV